MPSHGPGLRRGQGALPTHQVGCVGLCARDVLVEVHRSGSKTVYQYVKPDMVTRIVEDHLVGGTPVREWLVDEAYDAFYKKQIKVVLADCGRIDPEDIEAYKAIGGYEAGRDVLKTGTPKRSSRRSSSRASAAAAVPVSPRASNGSSAGRRRATSNISSATPMRETRARSWTAPSSRAIPTRSSRG